MGIAPIICPYSGYWKVGLVEWTGLVAVSIWDGEMHGEASYSGEIGDGGMAMLPWDRGGVEWPDT